MMDEKYSWVETHQQLNQYLKTKENSQQELINLLKSVDIGPFNDKSREGDHDIELDEIDPFTFYCYIYKYGSKKRLEKLQQISEKLNIKIPAGEFGVPTAQAQKVWLFPSKYLRVNKEVSRLWSFFNKELLNKITDEDFADVLEIHNVGKSKLTEALFYINAEKYLPINGPTKPYLKEVLNINPEFNTYTQYQEILEQVRRKSDLPFYELSYEAWKWNDENSKLNYWIFQGNPKSFDIETALREEILTDWTVSAHKDKIKIGDRVIIWVTGNKAGCYALAEITEKPRTIGTSPDDHLWKVKDTIPLKAGIKITYNLVNNPLLKSEISLIPKLKNLKVGSQGTNFTASEKEYELILRMIEQENSFTTVKEKFASRVVDNYINLLKMILDQLNIKKNDKRVVYSIGTNRLNFMVGQRYCFNIFVAEEKGNYGAITKEKLFDDSEAYRGTPPNPYYSYFDDFNPEISVWKSMLTAIENELSRTTISGFRAHNDKDFENYIFSTEEHQKTTLMNFPLNTIFYGPPGTGKTYNTILRAAEIIENRKMNSYKEALSSFKNNLHDQIEFIIFHQNYSYEDFIQGLRPDTENDNQLTFERKDGVFKVIADRALKNLEDSEKPYLTKKLYEEAFKEFINPLLEGEVEEIEVKMKKVSYFITAITNKSIDFRKASGGTAHALSIGTLKKMYDAESVLEIQGLASYYEPLLRDLLTIGKKNNSNKKEKVYRKNYVIIIDEINRANISRVFGELITLIEPDKRSHGEIPLEARLPSGDRFIVPSNLYIIGTMNTADKSIALLDIALRRRFEFEAMYPKYEIADQKIYDVEILRKINEHIIKSKGHDFQIGHAYFMGKDNSSLVKRMNTKVIPLLLEYYMNDGNEVTGILKLAGLQMEEGSWPLKISGTND